MSPPSNLSELSREALEAEVAALRGEVAGVIKSSW
jgi:hypothetical protein